MMLEIKPTAEGIEPEVFAARTLHLGTNPVWSKNSSALPRIHKVRVGLNKCRLNTMLWPLQCRTPSAKLTSAEFASTKRERRCISFPEPRSEEHTSERQSLRHFV